MRRQHGKSDSVVNKQSPTDRTDETEMSAALELSRSVRTQSPPNPWVGCRIVTSDGTGRIFEGATSPPPGPHAEVVALRHAGDAARGSTVYVTLEPCPHEGRTPPCTNALIDAGVRRVVVATLDPDPRASGRGISQLRAAGIEVEVGVGEAEASEVLAPYIKHRTTGRPFVVLKLAATLDGRIAAPDGDSRWITSEDALADVHRLRAESDAVLVGAGTVRTDDPRLTVRKALGRSPLRVVLGRVPPGAAVEPALSMHGDPAEVLDELGKRGILQLLVEGGAKVASEFHRAGLVDRYVFYFATALFGGEDALPMFRGAGAPRMGALWRGRLVSVQRFGNDIRVEFAPKPIGTSTYEPCSGVS